MPTSARTGLAQTSLPSVGRGDHTPPPMTAAPLAKNNVIAKPVRKLAVAIRSPCAVPHAPANASGGVLSASSGRKYPKNAAKTHGFGILSAAEVPTVPAPFRHANWSVRNSCRAFASSLRLHPRRALRLCWPGETGKTSAPTVRRREGTPPYKLFRRGRRPDGPHRACINFPTIRRAGWSQHAACQPRNPSGRAHGPCPTKITAVGRDPCVPPPIALLAKVSLAVAIRIPLRRTCGPHKNRVISRDFSGFYTELKFETP